MKHFSRILRIALQFKLTVLALFFSSLAIAVLWGGNIGALYPIVEVISQGQSLHEWVDKEIANSAKITAELQTDIGELRSQIESTEGTRRRNVELQVHALTTRLAAEEKALATSRRLEPWIKGYMPSDAFMTMVAIIGVVIVATCLKDACIVGNMLLSARLQELVLFDLRRKLFHHTLQMDLKSFGTKGATQLLARFNADLGAAVTGVSTLLGSALREPLKMIACLCGAAFISWRLLLFSLLLVPVAAFLIRYLAGSIKRANRRLMEEGIQLFQVLSDTYNDIQTVQAYTMEQHERTRFHRISREMFHKSIRIVFYNSLTRPATEVLGIGAVCMGLLAGAWLVLNQETHLLGIRLSDRPLSLSSLLVFYGMLIGTTDPARKLSGLFNQVQQAIVGSERVFEILDRPTKITDPPQPKALPKRHTQLAFENVHFHYESGQPVIRGLDLAIPHGEAIAIVGPNGCGKSTLVNLLPRFFDPVEGAVKIDGIDLRDVRLRDLRKRIGLVTQHSQLFDDTVMGNIRYGSPRASEDAVHDAARRAHAHKFILDKLDNGYETKVGHGGNRLSGGQRQRILLARAILRDPEFMILDEATSQVDLQSEQLIHEALKEFIRNRTSIVITHRLSTLQLVDRIMVMNGGLIEDIGTHDALMSRCDLYRRLHEIQFDNAAA